MYKVQNKIQDIENKGNNKWERNKNKEWEKTTEMGEEKTGGKRRDKDLEIEQKEEKIEQSRREE